MGLLMNIVLGIVGAAVVLGVSLVSCSLESAANRDQDTGSDKASNQIADPTPECDTDQAK
jgi:hypothetical protein